MSVFSTPNVTSRRWAGAISCEPRHATQPFAESADLVVEPVGYRRRPAGVRGVLGRSALPLLVHWAVLVVVWPFGPVTVPCSLTVFPFLVQVLSTVVVPPLGPVIVLSSVRVLPFLVHVPLLVVVWPFGPVTVPCSVTVFPFF